MTVIWDLQTNAGQAARPSTIFFSTIKEMLHIEYSLWTYSFGLKVNLQVCVHGLLLVEIDLQKAKKSGAFSEDRPLLPVTQSLHQSDINTNQNVWWKSAHFILRAWTASRPQLSIALSCYCSAGIYCYMCVKADIGWLNLVLSGYGLVGHFHILLHHTRGPTSMWQEKKNL